MCPVGMGCRITATLMPDSFDILTILRVLVNVFLVIVLYNLLFVVVDVRKITRRIEGITEELESAILKPISLTDKAFKWAMHALEKGKEKKHGKK